VSILLYSRNGDLAALAPRVGADLVITKAFARRKRLYQGLANLVADPEEAVRRRPEAIIFDQIGTETHKTGALADAWRKRGFPVWGAGAINDVIELDRGFGLSIAVECGIRIPKTVIFDPAKGDKLDKIDLEDRSRVHRVKGHVAEAQQFLKEVGGRWVLKPFDNAATSLTYVADTPEDMIHRLQEALDKHQLDPGKAFMLQAFVSGVEVSTEAWVVNGEIMFPANSTIETKKFLAGDLGPNTGCQTSVVYAYQDENPRLLRQTIGRPDFREWLRHPRGPQGEKYPPYHAVLDINSIVSEEDKKPYMLEFCPRFGYNAIYAYCELLDEDLHDLLVRVANGEADGMSCHDGVAYAVRVTIPPYPHTDELDSESAKDLPVLERMMEMATHVDILGPVEDPHVWLLDAQKMGKRIRTAGFDGVVLEVTARGETIEVARDQVNALFAEIDKGLPDAQARILDGTQRASTDVARLAAWGFEAPVRPVRREESIPEIVEVVPPEKVIEDRERAAAAQAHGGVVSGNGDTGHGEGSRDPGLAGTGSMTGGGTGQGASGGTGQG